MSVFSGARILLILCVCRSKQEIYRKLQAHGSNLGASEKQNQTQTPAPNPYLLCFPIINANSKHTIPICGSSQRCNLDPSSKHNFQ
ncbi:hypothetical protein DL95DRAFT_396276, partial [Leptodontidium sp. 2 PMI_412]